MLLTIWTIIIKIVTISKTVKYQNSLIVLFDSIAEYIRFNFKVSLIVKKTRIKHP